MTKQSLLYIEQLWDQGRRNYESEVKGEGLDIDEAMKLTGLIMKESSDSDRAEFVNETNGFDETTCNLADFLIAMADFKVLKDKIIQDLSQNAINHAKNTINEMFKFEKERMEHVEKTGPLEKYKEQREMEEFYDSRSNITQNY